MKRINYFFTYFTGFCSVIGLLFSFIGRDKITVMCKDHSEIATWVFLLLILIVLVFLCLYIHINEKLHILNKPKKLHLKTDYKPFVLVFDDEQSVRDDINEVLGENCNTILLPVMPHSCLADSFDFIIGDITGIGFNNINASSILNQIKQNYPFKPVIALSSNLAKAQELDKSIILVDKGSDDAYLSELLKHVLSFKKDIIDNSDKYCNNRLNEWKQKGQHSLSRQDSKRIKERFYIHFSRYI